MEDRISCEEKQIQNENLRIMEGKEKIEKKKRRYTTRKRERQEGAEGTDGTEGGKTLVVK